jgi:hypothetical protein
MRKNYYGRRKKYNNASATDYWKRYKETLEKARLCNDPIEKIHLYQKAEFLYKKSKDID